MAAPNYYLWATGRFLVSLPRTVWGWSSRAAVATWYWAKRMRDAKEREKWKEKVTKTTMETARHYYLGSKLFWAETRITWTLIRRVLRGHVLSRRERRQLVRTFGDLLRLVPFAFFVIVPFAELSLPFVLRIWPNILPSTFEDKYAREEMMKKRLQLNLDMANFLQDTLEDMAQEIKNRQRGSALSATADDLLTFMARVKRGDSVSEEDVLKFASLFEDEACPCTE